MAKLAPKYIIIPIRCKTEAYSEIEDYLDKGILTEEQVKEQLNEASEFRDSRLNTDLIAGYYTNAEGDITLIDIANGSVLSTTISIEELDELIRKAQPKTIWNLWGIL